MSNKKVKIARIATVPIALIGYKHMLESLEKNEFETSLIVSPGDHFEEIKDIKISNVYPINISREISPIKDLWSIIRLVMHFVKADYKIVHSNTPKAGLIVAIAGYIARVPIRLHTFTGQRWTTLHGMKRKILVYIDKLIGILNTHCYADSPSQVEFLITNGLIARSKISCIHKGSFAGIDLQRFNYQKLHSCQDDLLKKFGLDSAKLKIVYVGRIVKDKGIEELVNAFNLVTKKIENIELILVGPFEKENSVSEEIRKQIISSSQIKSIGFYPRPEEYLAIADIFCLPSYREGFGSVILEAAALKLPSIGSNITGIKDAIVDTVTGLLVPSHNVDKLAEAIEVLCLNESLRMSMGESAYQRVINDFDANFINSCVAKEYRRLLSTLS